MSHSFGHFLVKKDILASLEDLQQYQSTISIKRAKYYNPSLEDSEITIQPIFDIPDVDTEQARMVSEELTMVFA